MLDLQGVSPSGLQCLSPTQVVVHKTPFRTALACQAHFSSCSLATQVTQLARCISIWATPIIPGLNHPNQHLIISTINVCMCCYLHYPQRSNGTCLCYCLLSVTPFTCMSGYFIIHFYYLYHFSLPSTCLTCVVHDYRYLNFLTCYPH
jgi:hypothetical protein